MLKAMFSRRAGRFTQALTPTQKESVPEEMNARERRAQCPQCLHFMKLGEGEYCTVAQTAGAHFELIDWLPGRCEEFEKVGETAALPVG